jgi:molecular chaperone GrpE
MSQTEKDAGDGPADLGALLARLRGELEAEKAKAAEYLDLARRAKAEFLNYQDRIRRERPEWARQAVEALVREFLPALDAFSMARFEDPKLQEAMRIVEKEILRVLAKTGVVPIVTEGKAFDPVYHEAVSVDASADRPDGAILEEVRRGWMLDGRVLRAAGVRIAKAPPAGGS